MLQKKGRCFYGKQFSTHKNIVFAPKYRRKIIYYELRADIQKMIKDLCKWKSIEIIEDHMMPEHIHLRVKISLKMGVACFTKGERLRCMVTFMRRHIFHTMLILSLVA